MLTSALNGEALLVEQGLDFENQLHILAAIQAVTRSGFLGTQCGELGLPEAQDVGLDARELGDIADAEIELVGNFGARAY